MHGNTRNDGNGNGNGIKMENGGEMCYAHASARDAH